jgi:TrmH family RNA methyltransferase
MLTKTQQKLVTELVHSKKARRESGLFLIEGAKFVRDAKRFLQFSFTDKDVANFRDLISTETPQSVAGVAKIPDWTLKDVLQKKVVVVLDGLQDPGNVGTILRACLAFNASLILVEAADPTNPKAVRASAAAILQTPWIEISRMDAAEELKRLERDIYRLELREGALSMKEINADKPMILIAGNEGKGITLRIEGQSVAIPQSESLESLNVATAVSIALYELAF